MFNTVPTLPALPLHILFDIIEPLDSNDKLNLRLCSKHMKSLVDMSSPLINIKVTFGKDESQIQILQRRLPDVTWTFRKPGHYLLQIKKDQGEWENPSYNENTSEEMAHTFLRIVKTRLTRVKDLTITSHSNYDGLNRALFLSVIRNSLNKSRCKRHVRNLSLEYSGREEELFRIIPFLESGTLRTLKLKTEPPQPEQQPAISIIALYSQWKNAKVLKCSEMYLDLPFAKWKHFEQVEIGLEYLSLEVVKDVVKNCLETNTSKIHIAFKTCDYGIKDYLDQLKDIHRVKVFYSDSCFKLDNIQ